MPTLAKYWLLQLPSTCAVGLLLYWSYRAQWLSGRWAAGLLAGWVIKDAIMYPITRDAYRSDTQMFGSPVGGFAVVRQPLTPRGTVEMRGTLWRARCNDPQATIDRGETVRVTDSRGLLLTVEPVDRGDPVDR